MKWEQLCDDPALENIPYRVELARNGQLVMSPHQSYHSVFQSRIIRHFNRLLPDGEAMPECPIEVESGNGGGRRGLGVAGKGEAQLRSAELEGIS